MKELMTTGRKYYIYTPDNIYTEVFKDDGPRIYRCTKRTRVIVNIEERLEIVIKYHCNVPVTTFTLFIVFIY